MERLDKLVVYETDKGNHAVRPLNWAGIWDKDGKIKECGLNHIAVFHYKEDADWYENTKNAEEQGLLMRLPCKVGDTVYIIDKRHSRCSAYDEEYSESNCCGCECECDSNDYYVVAKRYIGNLEWIVSRLKEFGRTVFLTREEAEQALKQMGE